MILKEKHLKNALKMGLFWKNERIALFPAKS